ncbi:MAG: dihydrofolate reductase [Burkholderiales bacterium]|nr:dihydrofolate reductase [Burkholderiales bacterium]
MPEYHRRVRNGEIDSSGMTGSAGATTLGTLHHDTYFERMRASLGDKAQLLDHLVPGSVLDVGAGDGSLVRVIREHGWQATGIDASPESVARSGGLVALGYAEELADHYPAGSFDNFVFCSSLHEIWSYGDRWDTWTKVLGQAARLLAPGGRLIVRDGVGPAEPEAMWQLTLNDPSDGFAFLDQWQGMAEELLGPVRIDRLGDALAGPAWQVTEFLLTYGWGWGSLPREGAEFYTVAGTHAGCSAAIRRATGLSPRFSRAYLQPGYRQHFEQLGRLSAQPDACPVPWAEQQCHLGVRRACRNREAFHADRSAGRSGWRTVASRDADHWDCDRRLQRRDRGRSQPALPDRRGPGALQAGHPGSSDDRGTTHPRGDRTLAARAHHHVVTGDPSRTWFADRRPRKMGYAVATLEEALELARSLDDEISVAGGGSVYHQAWPELTELDLTEVHAEAEGTVFLPPVEPSEWQEVTREPRDGFDFVRYLRTAESASLD